MERVFHNIGDGAAQASPAPANGDATQQPGLSSPGPKLAELQSAMTALRGGTLPRNGQITAARTRALQASTSVTVAVGEVTVQIPVTVVQARGLIRRAQAMIDSVINVTAEGR
jgi:hypothetical protein